MVTEQQEIVRRAKALFALADQIEAPFQTAQRQVAALTPSLLARAFRDNSSPCRPAGRQDARHASLTASRCLFVYAVESGGPIRSVETGRQIGGTNQESINPTREKGQVCQHKLKPGLR